MPEKKRNTAKRFRVSSVFFDTVKKHPLVVLVLALAIAGSVVLTVVVPLVLGEAVDRLTDGKAVAFSLAMLYFALIALQGLLGAAKEALITLFGQKITHGLRSTMYQKMIRLPSSYFVRHEYGEITTRFVNDADTIEELFSSGIISMVADAASIIGIMVAVFSKSRGLFIILCVALPLLFLLTRHVQKKMLSAQKKNRAAIAREGAVLPATLSNIRTIHLFHAEDFYQDHYEDAIRESFAAMEANNLYDSFYSPVILTMSAAVIAVMMTLSGRGGIFLSWFGMTAGTAVALINYVNEIFTPLQSIGMEIQSIQAAMAGIARIGQFLDEPEKEQMPPCEPDWTKPALSVEGVDFSYDGSRKILDGFSLEVKTGESVTLSGRTGIGKSTLFRLILGLYTPDRGGISVFGVRPDSIRPEERRKVFGYVEQNFIEVPGTVRDQITLGDPSISESQIESALKLTNLYDTVQQLPERADTRCTRSMFSQGQWQLLSIARAVVTDPRILLLDEVTANLDSDTERLVLDALKRASENRTVVSISHRLYEANSDRRVVVGEKNAGEENGHE